MKQWTAWFCAAGLYLLLLPEHTARAHPGIETRLGRINDLLHEHPEQAALYTQRAAVLRHLHQFQPAWEDIARAESIGDPIEAAWVRGMLHFDTGEYDRAIAAYTQYLEKYPNHLPSLEYRARAAAATADLAAASDYFEFYFARDSHAGPANYLLSAQLLADGGEMESALELLDRGMERLGLIPALQRYAVELDLQLGNLASAMQRWQALEPALGSSPDWKVENARLLLMARETREAQAMLREAGTQLEKLRVTPARRQLQVIIREMQ